jgi:hypothetical protein
MPNMAQLASILGLGVLVIDEVQRLSRQKSGGAELMIDFFVELANTIGVPVVLIGTFEVLPLFQNSFAHARRLSGQGDMIWTNMVKDDDWDWFMENLWEYQWTNIESKLTPALNQALYRESGGIIDIAVKLYMLTQWYLIGQENERITPVVIRKVAKDSLGLVSDIIDAVRRNDTSKLSQIKDIKPFKIDSYLSKAKERVSLEGSINTLRNQRLAEKEIAETPTARVAAWLVTAGIDSKIAIECAKSAVNKHSSKTEINIAMFEALEMAREMEAKYESQKPVELIGKSDSKENTSPKVIPIQKNKAKDLKNTDLRKIVAKGKEQKIPAYESLVEAGIIVPVESFIKF